tara:strand:- start:41 stop:319 length:279 start_codon:yes stop_codon:yes gene_type:complete
MKITNIDSYKDGGTMKIVTDVLIYYIDNRLKSDTKGDIYIGYPGNEDSKKVLDQKSAKTEIVRALDDYQSGPFDWSPRVRELLEENLKKDEG